MNAKRLIYQSLFILLVFASACSPAAPTIIAQEPRQSEPQPMPVAEEPAAAEMPARPLATHASSWEEAPVRPPDNYFQDYGVNPRTEARYDNLSTFALDVDTASYTVTRRYLNDWTLPPFEAVRAEEFINFFDPGYAAPRDSAFTIYADGAPAPRGYEADSYVIRFGVQGYRVPEHERKPSNLTFVIDTSGSMEMENRLELVKRSLRLLVEHLDERDSVAIVSYGTEARVVLKPVNGSRRGLILDAIESLRPDGSTNAEAGLRLGYRYAQSMYQEGANNRIILCSDGVANVGLTNADAILAEVERYGRDGIPLTSIGVGMGNFNDVLLEQLADRGDGFYVYVDTLDEARKVFVDDLTSTLQIIARDAKVQVDFNTDVVESYRLIGYENRAIADSDFRNDEVDAGELGAGHSATALYVVRLHLRAEGCIATVQLRWQDPDTGEVREINGNFNTWDLAQHFDETDAYYRLAVTAAQFAEILRESPYIYDLSLADLARRADSIARELGDEQAREFAELVRTAAKLRR